MNFEKFRQINDEKLNLKEMDDANIVTEYKNEACGDDYKLFLKVQEGKIVDASFTTTGCGFGLAALAITCERARGRMLEEAAALTPEEIENYIEGFPPKRKRYPETALEVLKLGIEKAKALEKEPAAGKA